MRFRIAAIFLLSFLLFAGCTQQTQTGREDQSASNQQLTIIVEIDNGSGLVSKAVSVASGSTALQAFEAVADLELKQYGVGAYVSCINSLCEDAAANSYWQYYFDGKLAPVAVDRYLLNRDGRLEFRY